MSKELRFNDEVIASVAKVLQVAILTGTDIVDNLRMMKLKESEDGILAIHENYEKEFNTNIGKMLEEINQIKTSEN